METTSTLEIHLGYCLRRISNAVSGEFARSLQARQTSVAEWVLLTALCERREATPGDLATSLAITRGAVSKIIDKLEQKNWVRTRAHDGDGRSHLLVVTAIGRETLPALQAIADENDQRFFSCLDDAERSTLRGLLLKLSRHNNLHGVPTE